MKSLVLWTLGAVLMLASAAQADSCSQQAVAQAATSVLDADRTLRAIPVSQNKETDVPLAGRTAIAAMKESLHDYTAATLRCAPVQIAAKALQKALSDLVKPPQGGPAEKKQTENEASYGGGVRFDVRTLPPDSIGVVARFGIACGEDAMLMIFERHDGRWSETLRTQSEPYKTVAGGWWAFDYGAARDRDGDWFVVTKNVAPWCSSTWSEIRYQVLRPGVNAAHPRSLLAKTDSIWWSDTTGDLKVDANGFDLRWRAESMDGDVHNREWIAHYDIDGDRVVRSAPLAESPRDFADEWVRLDWKEAKDWTANPGLRPLHDQLRKQHYFSYRSVRRCTDGDHTQIEVEPAEGDQRHVFFQVTGKKVFVMAGAGFNPDPHYKGPNLFDINKPQ